LNKPTKNNLMARPMETKSASSSANDFFAIKNQYTPPPTVAAATVPKIIGATRFGPGGVGSPVLPLEGGKEVVSRSSF
jgi:hypothetical protein